VIVRGVAFKAELWDQTSNRSRFLVGILQQIRF
jgi:hypothetical protein